MLGCGLAVWLLFRCSFCPCPCSPQKLPPWVAWMPDPRPPLPPVMQDQVSPPWCPLPGCPVGPQRSRKKLRPNQMAWGSWGAAFDPSAAPQDLGADLPWLLDVGAEEVFLPRQEGQHLDTRVGCGSGRGWSMSRACGCRLPLKKRGCFPHSDVAPSPRDTVRHEDGEMREA